MPVECKKRGRPSRSRGKLTPEIIVNCARTLLQENGKVPSVRQVSGKLDVDPMAIYHYFSSKAALLEAVTVSLMETIYEPSGDGDWQEELRLLCRSYLVLLKEHAGLLTTMLSMGSESPAHVFITRFHEILSPLHLSGKVLKDAVDFLADYLHGFALAMHCNNDNQRLNVEMAEGPLSFYTRALAQEVKDQ